MEYDITLKIFMRKENQIEALKKYNDFVDFGTRIAKILTEKTNNNSWISGIDKGDKNNPDKHVQHRCIITNTTYVYGHITKEEFETYDYYNILDEFGIELNEIRLRRT